MALIPTAKRDQMMLMICVAALGLTYAFYQYVYTPKGEELDTQQEHVEKLTASNEEIRKEIARGTAAKLKEEADMYGRMLALMRQLSDWIDDLLVLEAPTLQKLMKVGGKVGSLLGVTTKRAR